MVEGLDVDNLCVVANTADEIRSAVADLMSKTFDLEQIAQRKSRMEEFYSSSRTTDCLVELLG